MFEARTCEWLEKRYGVQFVRGPWFRYLVPGESRARWCQPDGLLVDIAGGRITIVEIKLRHTSDSWWQLRQLYDPVVRKVFGPNFEYGLSTIVRWYDVGIPYPEQVRLSPHPHRAESDAIQVTIHRP